MENNIKKVIADISEYESRTFQDNVKDRLDLTLKQYLKELDNSYDKVLMNIDKKIVVKELSR